MERIDMIIGYIDILKNQLGLDIIIYDECGLLKNTCLTKIDEVGKWHTNPYCLKIKENKRLRNRCVSWKPDFVKKILKSVGVVKSTCFCGVTEYVIPIKLNQCLVCMVSAVGFEGEIKERTAQILSRCVGLDYESFVEFRKESLANFSDEKKVVTAIEILRHLLLQFILENTDIPHLIESKQHSSNEHILKAMDYISSNFSKPIDSKSVADYCHINVSYLQHLFSCLLGHGIAEEIKLRRLAFAEELICTTDYSIRYISFLSGFSSPDYFSTAFKRYFGDSPLNYRNKNSIRKEQ